MRVAWLFFVSALMASPPAAADCEYRPEWRGRDTATYFADATTCLETLKDGFWIDAAVEADVFGRVNAARRDAGLAPLRLREELIPPARLHSFDMGQDLFFDHQGPDGRSVSDRVAALDRSLIHSEVRENLAVIEGDFDWSDTGEVLHNILFNSDGHRENMLSPTLTHMAMGVVRSEKGAWITQVFVREEGTFTAPLPTDLSQSAISLPLALMHDWSFREVLIEQGGVEHQLVALESRISGDADIVMVGTKPVDERSYQIIKLPGPSITVTD